MTRRSGNSRVSASNGIDGQDRSPTAGAGALPPMRKRRPWIYWTVIIATAAMVLTTFASVISAFT